MSAVPRNLADDIDRRAFDSLVALVASGQALALVGAGVSARIGYPAWGTLLNVLHARAGGAIDGLADGARREVEDVLKELPARPRSRGPEQKPPVVSLLTHRDSLWRAQEYRDLLGDDFTDVLCRVFGGTPKPDETLRRIVGLPFRHVLTTNYDHALEHAHRAEHQRDAAMVNWSDRAEALDFLFRFFHPDYDRRYVHLHGHVGVKDSLVLTDLDYTRRYVRSDDEVKRLFALFAMQRVVFFGFSMDDPDLVAILRQVNAAAGHEEPRHFAVMALSADEDRRVHRRRFFQKYGVLPVFFERREGDGYEGLAVVVRDLADAVAERTGAPAGVPPGAGVVAATREGGAAAEGAVPADDEELPDPGPVDADDPQKGRFGGSPRRRGRVLSATVQTKEEDWYAVTLRVEAEPGQPPIPRDAMVLFHLHDTFTTAVRRIKVKKDGAAEAYLECYGAFTVGAVVKGDVGGDTRLELDLALLESAPMRFRTS